MSGIASGVSNTVAPDPVAGREVGTPKGTYWAGRRGRRLGLLGHPFQGVPSGRGGPVWPHQLSLRAIDPGDSPGMGQTEGWLETPFFRGTYCTILTTGAGCPIYTGTPEHPREQRGPDDRSQRQSR